MLKSTFCAGVIRFSLHQHDRLLVEDLAVVTSICHVTYDLARPAPEREQLLHVSQLHSAERRTAAV